jgi:ribosome maturation factor RimP
MKLVTIWKWDKPAFFYCHNAMTHPLIPQIMELAIPIAEELGLEVVEIVFQTNKRPPVVRVDIRNRTTDTSLNNCERMSLALGEKLEEKETIATAYVLEVSSPGVSKELISDRDFISFKGFSVVVITSTPEQNRIEWRGRLQGRDANSVYLNQKGKAITVLRSSIIKVELEDNS